MTTRHHISSADVLMAGNAYDEAYSAAYEGRRGIARPNMQYHQFGAPDTADANGIVESQNLTAAGVFSSSGTAAAAIAAAALAGDMGVPRNVVAAWTGTAVITITGTDVYGRTMVESSGSGTSLTGKKAFKTVTDVSVSSNVTSLTVGSGDVLGLPFAITNKDDIIAANADGSVEDATIVVADTTDPATATTGDVRGTVDFTQASNGTIRFGALFLIDHSSRAAAFGVDQFAG